MNRKSMVVPKSLLIDPAYWLQYCCVVCVEGVKLQDTLHMSQGLVSNLYLEPNCCGVKHLWFLSLDRPFYRDRQLRYIIVRCEECILFQIMHTYVRSKIIFYWCFQPSWKILNYHKLSLENVWWYVCWKEYFVVGSPSHCCTNADRSVPGMWSTLHNGFLESRIIFGET